MKSIKLTILFLVINFGGLAIGSWLMNNGPITDWYMNLNQAPWTPPGWVFGVAWATIMICFSVYLSQLFRGNFGSKIYVLYVIQVILNVSWNYIFFNLHEVLLALIFIVLLTILVFYFFINYFKRVRQFSFLLVPYMIWMLIATSLNAYIYFNN